ncbi:WAT1-related protein At1g68170-like [Primulina eburnea]|uniref:WAT1-related protein At1g68170-like n=1 Tax=Primulina eburnea TaxID=1245227 RepID=UPI003C6C3DEB
MEQICCCAAAQELKPIMLMILNQIASGGVNLFYILSVADGMKSLKGEIWPESLSDAWKSRPRFSKMVALQAFVSGLLGEHSFDICNIYTAMYSIIPALTFVLAVIFRYLKLVGEVRNTKIGRKAKVLVSALSISGEMVLSFYKGINVTLWSRHVDLLQTASAASNQRQQQSPLLGSLLAVSSCFSYASWYMIQVILHE